MTEKLEKSENPALLLKLSFVLETGSENDPQSLSEYPAWKDRLVEELEQAISAACANVLTDQRLRADYIRSTILILDPKAWNCGRCSECGRWVSDRESPDTVYGLPAGARVNGRLLCFEDLPQDHWAADSG